uniref:Uncharacterized protein n=1 Tax=Arcella intermedia TaxID=1963864 RepID=A0A6B2LJ19_9EUKA
MVVVGDGAVGKTCLLMSYVQNLFPNGYTPTVFDNFSQDIQMYNRPISVTFWDTAGQEEYDRLRPLSYPNTDVFLVCFSVSSQSAFANAQNKWWPEITHFCETAVVLLVGTKQDLRSDPKALQENQFVTTQEAKELSQKMGAYGYMECSALTREGLEEVFHTAIKSCLPETYAKSNNARLNSAPSKHRKNHCVVL